MPSSVLPTLIVPSVHSRAALLHRALTHLERQDFSGEVIVSDHSAPDRLGVLQEVVDRHARLRVLVLEHDPAWHFLQRLTDCAETSASEYIAVHADDDFMFVDAMAECTRFLAEHADYAAAKGRMLFFNVEGGELKTLSRHEGFTRAEADVAKRLLRHIANFNATLYAVHRRAQFIDAYRSALSRTQNVIFWQYLASCITLVHGKLQVFDRAYYYRLDNPAGWRSTLVRERSPEHWPRLILAPEFPALLETFGAGLRQALCSAGVAFDLELERALDEAYLWLIRRALCGMLEQESLEADSAFLGRATEAGSAENRLLAACVSLVQASPLGAAPPHVVD